MANNIPFNTMVAKTALPILKARLPMAMNANKDYQDTITDENARNGGVIAIKKPARYIGRDGELMKVESTVQPTLNMNLQMSGCDVAFSNKDLQLTMDEIRNGGLDTALEPAMDAIAAKIESAGTSLYKTVPNVVGNPGSGTLPLTSVATANAYITSLGGMSTGRHAVIDPFASASLAGSVQQFFNPTKDISDAYKSGSIGKLNGFEFWEDPAIQSHRAGVYGGTPLVNGSGQVGSVLVTDGWSTNTSLNVGDTFTIAGVNSVNPQTRVDTGRPQNFVVTAKSSTDASGNSFISVYPAITPEGQFQTVSASPADNAAITVTSGTSGQVSKQSILYDPRAFTFASVPMAKPKGNNFDFGQANDKESGISISYITQYDAKTNQVLHRMDVLFAWAATYPELAVRAQS